MLTSSTSYNVFNRCEFVKTWNDRLMFSVSKKLLRIIVEQKKGFQETSVCCRFVRRFWETALSGTTLFEWYFMKDDNCFRFLFVWKLLFFQVLRMGTVFSVLWNTLRRSWRHSLSLVALLERQECAVVWDLTSLEASVDIQRHDWRKGPLYAVPRRYSRILDPGRELS
jgi:hypothetical protein